MVSKRRLHDKYVSWRKLFASNWSLFKASRIGLVGLAIMIGFIIVALAVPFMGLRDPLYWTAPQSDVISPMEWWQQTAGPGHTIRDTNNGSVDHEIAVRVEAKALNALADRVYAPEGSRLWALNVKPTPGVVRDFAWGSNPFETTNESPISVDPIVENYGSDTNADYANYSVIFGTEDGRVYVLNDHAGVIIDAGVPSAVSRELDGSPVTALAAYSSDELAGTTDRDIFVVGTEQGRVYAFTVNRMDNASGETFFHQLWVTPSLGSPVHMAGELVAGSHSVPFISPAFYITSNETNAESLYLGTGDGRIVSLWTWNGTVRWEQQVVNPPPGTMWTSAPITSPATELKPARTLVYAAGQDYNPATSEIVSKIWVLYADGANGRARPLETWNKTFFDGGIPIYYRGQERGVVQTPAVEGSLIFVTASDGWLFAVNRDPVIGRGNVIETDAGAVVWAYRDNGFHHDATHGTYFASPPHVFKKNKLVIVAGNYDNGTATPWDDIGVVYVFNEAQPPGVDFASPTWRQPFGSAVLSRPPAWEADYTPQQVVFVGTIHGDLYCSGASGVFLAPLAPSWAVPTPYASGNYYILGTDAQGHDIFSQLLWGSRIALLVGFASAAFSIGIGVVIGLVAGFLGGRVESVLMRFTDVILVIPALPLVIIMAAVLGAGIWNIILVISIVGWPGVARVIRSEVLSLKERPFIDSARVTGASNVRIMFRHVAPNVAPLAFLYMTFAVSGAILTEAALSFIGLGDVNTISWGIMLQNVSQSKALEAWWWLLPPGLAITLISLAFFLVGRAFDEIVNPRLRKR